MDASEANFAWWTLDEEILRDGPLERQSCLMSLFRVVKDIHLMAREELSSIFRLWVGCFVMHVACLVLSQMVYGALLGLLVEYDLSGVLRYSTASMSLVWDYLIVIEHYLDPHVLDRILWGASLKLSRTSSKVSSCPRFLPRSPGDQDPIFETSSRPETVSDPRIARIWHISSFGPKVWVYSLRSRFGLRKSLLFRIWPLFCTFWPLLARKQT